MSLISASPPHSSVIFSLLLAEAAVANKESLVESLEKDLGFSREQLRFEYEIKAKLLEERSATAAREEALTAEAQKYKNDLQEIKNRYILSKRFSTAIVNFFLGCISRMLDARYGVILLNHAPSDERKQTLQEQFEEQTVMLRMEKKAHGDVQVSGPNKRAHFRLVDVLIKSRNVFYSPKQHFLWVHCLLMLLISAGP